jgi:predicted SAM-dependent methyltransferase
MYYSTGKKLFNKHKHPENKPFEDYLEAAFAKGGIFLDVGCGSKKLHPAFIGVDPYIECPEVNVQAYMWDTPFGDDSVDMVLCFSALEHVSKFHVLPTLKEFARIMKPGATLGIVVPNLMMAVIEWLDKQTTGYDLDMIFGSQEHEGEYHRTGFSVPMIVAYFANVPELKLLNIYDINGYSQWNYGILARKV